MRRIVDLAGDKTQIEGQGEDDEKTEYDALEVQGDGPP